MIDRTAEKIGFVLPESYVLDSFHFIYESFETSFRKTSKLNRAVLTHSKVIILN